MNKQFLKCKNKVNSLTILKYYDIIYAVGYSN